MQEQINAFENDKQEYEKFKKDKKQMEEDLKFSEDKFKALETLKNLELQEKEREKIQATEKLRKEMLYKIKETKANLLALNDEQVSTTTTLTILQNKQLTTELQYQSEQTEILLCKNNEM